MSDYLPMFKNKLAEAKYFQLYKACLELWPVEYSIKKVETDFGTTSIIVSGEDENPPLLLLHGASSTSLMWVPNVSDLALKYKIYAIDTIGDVGKSQTLKPFKNKEEAADWLVQILNELQIERSYIAGMSYGSFLGLNLSILKPAKVTKLILISPGEPFLPLRLVFWFKFLYLMINPSKKVRLDFLKWSNGNNDIIENDFTEMVFTAMKYAKYYISPTMKTIFSKKELNRLNIPVLLLVGENEVLVNVKRLIEKAKNGINNLEIGVISDSSHTLSSDQPEIVNKYMIDFLEK